MSKWDVHVPVGRPNFSFVVFHAVRLPRHEWNEISGQINTKLTEGGQIALLRHVEERIKAEPEFKVPACLHVFDALKIFLLWLLYGYAYRTIGNDVHNNINVL